MNVQTNPTDQSAKRERKFRLTRTRVGLFALLSLALALRLYGINWDQGGLYHPDERAFLFQVQNIEFPESSEYGDLLSKESPLNPGSFNWGSFPHYALKIVHYGMSVFTDDYPNMFDLRYPGRALSAISDTATVLLVYFIGATWFSRRTGFLAAAFAALSVINIQLSHFFAVDAMMATFITATVFFSVKVAYSGQKRDSALLGLMAGLGFATKFSVAPLGLAVVTGYLIFAFSQPGETLSFRGWRSGTAAVRQWKAFQGLVLASAVALVTVVVTQPYMFFDFDRFMSDITTQGDMVRRNVDFPFTRQYEDTATYWYQIWQLGFWGLGPALGLIAWSGLIAAAAFAWFGRRKVDIVILAWVVPYLLITGYFDVKFMRYMVPLVPFLVLYGARSLLWLSDVLKAMWPERRYVAALPIVIVLAFTVQYALSFMNVYNGLHPANAASEWLEQNADPGSTLVQEHWEEGIKSPRGIIKVHNQLGLYDDPDGPSKFERITNELELADYLVFYSNRLYGTIPRLPERYPLSSQYYEKLFNGSLGYQLVFSDTRPVRSLGISYYEDQFVRVPFDAPEGFEKPDGALLTIAPGWADESFSVYEHPTTLLFENTGRLTAEEMLAEIGALSPSGQPDREIGLQLDEDDLATQREGGTWTDITFLRGLPEGLSWIVWLFAAELMALAALPLAYVVFQGFPDRGYLLAKPLGLLLAGTVTWLLASGEIVHFSFVSALLGILAIAAVSGFVFWRRGPEITAYYRERKKFVIFAEAIFLLAFFSFLAIRFANPDLWHPFRGGEKPMDFAYLNAVTRSSVMPPYDPWFSGGYLNYYYYGQFLIADMIRLTGIVPSVAYNLAIPLLFAFAFTAAFSIIYNLTALTLTARKGAAAALRSRSPAVAGLLAATLVAVAGNIDGLVQLVEGARRALFDNVPAGTFDFWRSSRLFEPGSPGNEITEFPFFSFLFADLHAHMIVIPFAILALSVALSVFLRASESEPFAQKWGRLAVLGITIGVLRIINAWDFPTQLLLAGGATLVGEMFAIHRPITARIASGALKWIFVAAVGYIVYLPFHLNFELFNNGVLKSEFETPLWRYFAIHSVFLLVILSWAFWEIKDRFPTLRARFESYAEENSIPLWIAPFVAVALLAVVATFFFTEWATLVFTVLMAVLALVSAIAAFNSRRLEARYVMAAAGFVVMAMAIGGGVDMFTVKDDIGRMNTVFKFYLQAWWLLALASGYFLWVMWSAGRFSLRRMSPPRGAWMAGLAILLVGVMVYPVFGTNVRIRDRFDTQNTGLDGMDYMDTAIHFERSLSGQFEPMTLTDDKRAIEWMQRNIDGSPVIVEGITDLYRWGGRVSIYTGLPAVIGWDWHQRQQRVNYAWAVTQRRNEVDVFYRSISTSIARDFLNQYEVRYVYVGELERRTYPADGIAKFDDMDDIGLTPVYTDGSVTIYEYSPPDLVALAP